MFAYSQLRVLCSLDECPSVKKVGVYFLPTTEKAQFKPCKFQVLHVIAVINGIKCLCMGFSFQSVKPQGNKPYSLMQRGLQRRSQVTGHRSQVTCHIQFSFYQARRFDLVPKPCKASFCFPLLFSNVLFDEEETLIQLQNNLFSLCQDCLQLVSSVSTTLTLQITDRIKGEFTLHPSER